MSGLPVGHLPNEGAAAPVPAPQIGIEDGCWNCREWSRVGSAIGRCYTKGTGFGVPACGQMVSFLYRCAAHAKITSQQALPL